MSSSFPIIVRFSIRFRTVISRDGLTLFLLPGQSKSLTFEEALREEVAREDGDNDSQAEKKSGGPDPCCPDICSKM